MNNDSAHDSQPSSSLTPWHWGWSAALALIVLVTLAFRYALPVRDGDLWFHMLYGKYFLEHHTLIADHTIFSWTPTTNDTIYVTWLPDIFLYLLHKAAGLPGIFAFRYLCMLVPVLGCFLYARKLKIATHPLTWLLCLLAVIMSYTAAFEKPEILSFVFMTLLAWNWWHIRSSGEEAWKNCYLFPLIMLVWVNTHGGFVFGAAFLVLIGLGELLNTWLSPQNVLSARLRKHLVIALLLASTTPFLNPYGYHYPLQLFYDLLPTQENVKFNNKVAAYTAPFSFSDTYNLALAADIAILLLLLLFIRNFKRVEWSSLLANLAFAFLYTRFFRTTFYWVPIFLFSGLNMLAWQTLIPKGGRHTKIYNLLFPGIILVASCGLASNTLYKAAIFPEKWLWMGFGIGYGNPVSESEYIKRYFPIARIGNTYDQGAYLLWELWPRNKVFFDSRHFPYKKWSDEFFSFAAGKNIHAVTEQYPCDLWCIGLQHTNLLMGLLLSKEWKLAFYGKNAAVLVRHGVSIPLGAPRVDAHLFSLQNFESSFDLLRFAIYIGDFQVAEELLGSMTSSFTSLQHQSSLRRINHYLYGLKAYQEKHYGLAARKLGLIANPPEHVRFIHTNCYQYLTLAAWEQAKDTDAMKFAQKSLELVPDNPYSLYNTAVIGWWLEKMQPEADASVAQYKAGGRSEQGSWRASLQKFMQQARGDQDFAAFHEIALAILDDRQTDRPRLLIPPEPTGRKFFLEGNETEENNALNIALK